jgi:hypothetical protein
VGDVVDYSWARPAPADLARRGYTGAMRYLSYEPGKNLSHAERDALWAAGIAIGFVWETVPNRPLAGYTAGAEDGRAANRQADDFGWPAWVPIAYAVDFDPANRLGAVVEYFKGALSVGGRPVGVYGTYSVLEALAPVVHQGRRVECYWQCAGWSGSGSGSGGSIRLDDGSNRRVSRHACLYQDISETRHSGEDHNHVLGHVAFLFHPDQAPEGGPALKEKIMANGVKLPDIPESGDSVWVPSTDGVGRPRRYEAPYPDGTSALLEAGIIDEIIPLTGNAGRWFWNTFIEVAPVVAEWTALSGNLAQTKDIEAAIAASVTDALDGIDTPELPASFAADVAGAVLAKIGPTVTDAAAAGVDRELDKLSD